MTWTRTVVLSLAVLTLTAACVSVPSGPSVMVLPGSGKSFDQFQWDDANCRQWAAQQSGIATAGQQGTSTTVSSAAIGTVLGAAAGAAIGAAAGNPGLGAAAGAGAGLLGGSAYGASATNASYYEMQRAYDTAYVQCMYARGNQVPAGRGVQQQQPGYSTQQMQPAPAAPPPPPPPAGTPLPPAGAPPPPPPGPTR